MIKYIKHTDIDKTKWDYCIELSFNKTIYAYSWYLDIVSPNWDALIDDDYIAVMPLTHRKKYGISYIFQPLICQQLGVFSTTEKEDFYIDDFIDAIPQKFKLIEMAVNVRNLITKIPGKRQVTDGVNYELSLHKPYDSIYSKYSKNNIKNINKTSTAEIVIEIGNDSYDEFFNLRIEDLKLKKIKITLKDTEVFYNLLKTFGDKKRLKIYIVKNKANIILGGICFVFIKNRVISQSFSSDTGRKISIGFYMFDMFFKEHAGQDIIYDFMGSNIKSIAYRNEGFGSSISYYKQVKIIRLPILFKYIKAIWDRFRAFLS